MQIYQEFNKLNMQRRNRRNAQNAGPIMIGDKEMSDDLSERFDQLTDEFHYGHSALVDTRYNS
jgi:hypothetical protein